MHFDWSSLKGRKLVRWLLGYVAAVWLGLQALDVVGGLYGVPPWLVRALPVVIGLGLLATGVFAWFHGRPGRQPVQRTELLLLAMLVVASALAVAAISANRPGASQRTVSEVEEATLRSPNAGGSLAVLPFENLSGVEGQRYFAAGLADELITVFSRIEGIHVASRTASFAFQGRAFDIEQIGRDLGVQHILEGSVRVSGDRIRITARLVKAIDGHQVWGEEYDRKLGDVIELQEEIARAIVNTLGVRLLGDPSRRLIREYTDDLNAYQAYLRGRYQQDQVFRGGGEAAAIASIDAFREALAHDPGYALAWAGIADSYAQYLADAYWPPHRAYPLAQEAAVRAVELDPNLAEGRIALAGVRFWYGWDHDEALAELGPAIELDPRSLRAHWLKGLVLHALGRYAEGEDAWRVAHSLDPTHSMGRWYGRLRSTIRPPESVLAGKLASLRAAGQTANATSAILWQLATAEYLAENHSTFLELAARRDPGMLTATPDDRVTDTRAAVAVALARTGRSEEAGGFLAAWHQRAQHEYVPPSYFAKLYANLDSIDEAFQWLERAVEARDAPLAVFLLVDPAWDPLRNDPRFHAIRRAAGLGRTE